jgi:predicted metal-dependent phosphotriesterase family hydrolase
MPLVRTVLGDCNSLDLGFTHCHEHLFVFPTRGVRLPGRLIIDEYELTKCELLSFLSAGGRSLVDAQPFGAGRHPQLLVRAAVDVGLNIIAATGVHKSSFYAKDCWIYRATVEELTELFISEIREGMYSYDPDNLRQERSDAPAGIIKVAMDADGFTPHYRKVFEAASRAHRETGVPILTHTELSTWGYEQAEFLLERGVCPGSIIISHMDRAANLQHNLAIARLGVYLEYDTIARSIYHDEEKEMELIQAMIKAGFGDRILLGMDVTRERLPAYGGRFGLAYLAENFLPRLRDRGLSQKDIETLMIANPARALALRP